MAPEGLDTERRGAILSACLTVVAETGYDRLTMDAVAARARASKATLYRHWDGKAELVADAVRERHLSPVPELDTGSVRGDLLATLRLITATFQEQDVALTQGLLTAMHSQPQLASCMRTQLLAEKRSSALAWGMREIARGNLPADADAELLCDVAMPMLLIRLFVTGEPVDEPFFQRVVDDVVLPLLLRPRTSREDHVDGRSNDPRPGGPPPGPLTHAGGA